MNFHGKPARYLFARSDRYRFAHLIISRVSSLPILIKSHTWHSGKRSQHFQISKIDISRHPMDICVRRACDRVACAWARACMNEGSHADAHHTGIPHERAELIMHSLFYQYPEYRVRHVSRMGAGRCSQPLRSSARRYPPPSPPFATAIPRLTDWGEERRRRRREREKRARGLKQIYGRGI